MAEPLTLGVIPKDAYIDISSEEADEIILRDGQYYLGEKVLIMPNEENSGSEGYSSNSMQREIAIVKFTYYLSINWDLYDNFGFKVYDITAYVISNERIQTVKGDWKIPDYYDKGYINSGSFSENTGSAYSRNVEIGTFTCPYDTIKVKLNTSNVYAYLLNGHGWVYCAGLSPTFDIDD